MSTSERFTQLLDQYRIVLEDDAVEYINSMLYDMTLSSCNDQQQDDIHESINAFLLDANIDKNKRDDFFTSLFSSIKPQQESYPTNNVQYEEHLIDDVKIPKQIARRINKRNNNNNNKTKRQQLTQNINKYNNDEELDIIAISQQSRFHTETLETSNKDIDLHGVQISVVSQHNGESIDLLVDAHLKLKPFTRYGLIGQNGVGKSILMRCLADNILVGLPQNLNILHITQLEDFNESTTAVQEVLDADKNATIILKEYQALQTVVGGHDTFLKESKATQAELNKVVFSIMQSRIKDKVDEASRLAIKRSGLRGREARKELIKIEKEYDDFCQRDPQKYITAEMVNDIMLEVYGKYEMIDQEERLNRAKRILRGLGFSENQSTTACISTLSGGWRMRIALAKLLFKNPDILLLDEPTNHLDLSAILWLQEYLIHETDDMTVVVVSHDREFLNNVTEETIILKDKQLKYHAGNYQDWENTTEEQRIRKQALLDSTEKKKNKILVSIQENLQRAKTTGDDKRHGMINSRRKKLDRLGMEKTEDGKRFKLSQHRAGYHSSSREEIIVEKGFKTASIKIPEPIPLRYNGSSLYMNEVTFRYQGMSKNIIESFSIHIGPHSRIAFIGPNGCGKSTLLNLLTSKIQPTKGEVYRHPLLRIGYFSQHIVDHELNLDLSPVEYMMKRYPTLTEQECRAHFGIVGLSGNHIVLQKIRSLSGGQRNRVAFAIILYEQPQVLILDEITNHLDMGTVEMLVDAFKGFSGALIVVSHDIWFLKQIFEQSDDEDTTTAKKQNEIYTIKQGRIQKWEKGIDSYVASVLRNMRNQNK
ncbi:P-loop containing nucleoside triphosphate hydrolase protein [Cokeromyces recurvatus]|uniref:P-loop containing nucleoside triphosphate hydrolase protein n=1 Tax=Cokeromyces recurvatus TaxID=90255 RepID=UPI00221E5FF8|nr:P-loop containing nucleoside triphosphate hydrolase protein [Cokeromyces recurvatus]KAI7907657.1 P-loop containing nucleoside triphosphate hydrolase protein [Cokeromyces recurvatus]